MDSRTASFPKSVSVYEIIRLRPAVRSQLVDLGLTEEFLGYRLGEAARAVGVSPEKLEAIVQREALGSR